jgi:hypothetical protein
MSYSTRSVFHEGWDWLRASSKIDSGSITAPAVITSLTSLLQWRAVALE